MQKWQIAIILQMTNCMVKYETGGGVQEKDIWRAFDFEVLNVILGTLVEFSQNVC